MQRDLGADQRGTAFVLLFYGTVGGEFIEQKFITIDAEGNEQEVDIKKLNQNKIQGVKFVIRNLETKKLKTVYYFSTDISNEVWKKRPGLTKFIQARAPFNTFVKSASYCMHDGKQFSSIRSLVVDNTVTLFQDDTGVPYRFFEKKPEWKVLFLEST